MQFSAITTFLMLLLLSISTPLPAAEGEPSKDMKKEEAKADDTPIDLKKSLEEDAFTFLSAFGETVQKHKKAYDANKSKRPAKPSDAGLLKREQLPLTLWKDQEGRGRSKGKLAKRRYIWFTDYSDGSKKQNRPRFTFFEVRHTPIQGFKALHKPVLKKLKSLRDLSSFKTIADGESWMKAINIHSAEWGTETNLRAFAAFLHLNDYHWPRNRVLALLVARNPQYQKPVAKFLRNADGLEDGLKMIRRYVFDSAVTNAEAEPAPKKKPKKKSDQDQRGQAKWYVLLHVDPSKKEAGVQAAAEEARKAWNAWAKREIEALKYLYANFYHFTTKVEWKHLQGKDQRGKSKEWEHEVRSLNELHTRCEALFDTLKGSEILLNEKNVFDKAKAKQEKKKGKTKKGKAKKPSLSLAKSDNIYAIHSMLQKADSFFKAKLDKFKKDVEAADDARLGRKGENEWVKLYRDALADIFEVLPHYTTSKMKLKKRRFALGAANPWLFRRISEALRAASVPDELNRQVSHNDEGLAAEVFANANLRYFPDNPYARFLLAQVLMSFNKREAATKLFIGLRDSNNPDVSSKLKKESKQFLNQMKKFR